MKKLYVMEGQVSEEYRMNKNGKTGEHRRKSENNYVVLHKRQNASNVLKFELEIAYRSS